MSRATQRTQLASQELMDRHRFECPSSWLDRETRLKRKAKGEELGYGYANTISPAKPRPTQPFYILENSFTSGTLVARRYDMSAGTLYKTDEERTDPYHFPNALNVKDEDHYKEWRMRSACTDIAQKPKEAPRKIDAVLANNVTDFAVDEQLRAKRAEKRVNVDPICLGILHDKNMTCVAKHKQEAISRWVETGSARRERAATLTATNAVKSGGDAAAASNCRAAAGDFMRAGAKNPNRWSWVVSDAAKRPSTPDAAKAAEKELTQSKSMSSLIAGPSMLGGKVGGNSQSTSNFHGVAKDGPHERVFGLAAFGGRMRGGELAKQGYSGSFPSNSMRPTFGQL